MAQELVLVSKSKYEHLLSKGVEEYESEKKEHINKEEQTGGKTDVNNVDMNKKHNHFFIKRLNTMFENNSSKIRSLKKRKEPRKVLQIAKTTIKKQRKKLNRKKRRRRNIKVY